MFVPGPSLQDTVDVAGVLPEEPALRLAAGLAAALGEIHRAGLVHRDLKPSNVLLTADGVRVIDFGIARAVDGDATELTRSGWLIGSPGFMSPEQAEGHELTAASDVFSLGSVLVMACTGQSPFAGSSTPRTLYNVVHADPDLSALPPAVRRIAKSCLVKAPADRPSPAGLLAAISPVTPSTTPWPADVHRLIDKQHAEVAGLLNGTVPEHEPEEVVPEGTVDLRTTAGPTTAVPTTAVPAPVRPRRRGVLVAALVAVVVVAAAAGLVVWSPWSKAPEDTTETPAVTLDGHTRMVNDIAYSPDGTKLVTGSDDATVRLWDVTGDRQLAEWDAGDPVNSVAFNADGTLVAAISSDTTVMVWDVGTRERTAKLGTAQATDVAFSPDGTLVVGAGESVFGWDMVSRQRTDLVVRTQEPVADVAFSPDGRILAVADASETVVLWDVPGERRAGTLTAPDDSDVRELAFNADGTVLGTDGDRLGEDPSHLRLWDVPGSREVAAVTTPPDSQRFTLSPDGRTLVTAARNGTVLLYRR